MHGTQMQNQVNNLKKHCKDCAGHVLAGNLNFITISISHFLLSEGITIGAEKNKKINHTGKNIIQVNQMLQNSLAFKILH